MNNSKYKNIIYSLVGVIIILASTTGWDLLDLIGMNVFWLIFMLLSVIVCTLMYLSVKKDITFKDIVSDRLNQLVLIYLIWCSVTYLINSGKSSLMYIFKMFFILGVYLVVANVFLQRENDDSKALLLLKVSKYIFVLGCIHSVIALYQFSFNTNTILGVKITSWPAYNPASMYGNVNGLGTYLFFSIVGGIYYMLKCSNDKVKALVILALTVQGYALYLTVSRTSIVALFMYIVGGLIICLLYKRDIIFKVINKRNIAVFILANLVMFSIINIQGIKSYFESSSEHTESVRKTSDMLEEKNSKGINQRQFIWEAVIKDYKEYIVFGDGLKYKIVKKIDVENVISKKSVGLDRISYHNTLFRYFASHGLIGLIIFLALFSYVPIRLFITVRKEKNFDIRSAMILILIISIFAYMQMEEVYIGEIGLSNIITVSIMAYGNSLCNKLNSNRS